MSPDPASPRPKRSAPLSLLAVTLAMFAPLAAHAHQYWLAPSRYDAAPGQSVGIGAIAGTGFRGERKPWSPARAVRFVARTSRLVDLAPAASIGEETWLRFAPADPGGAMLAYESNFTSIELPAATFDAYLTEEGLDGPLATRRAMHTTTAGRERYRRCAKAWLFGADETRASAAIGMPLEIVPEFPPGAAPVLRARLLWQGRPLAGALVQAWCAGAGSDGAARDSVPVAWRGRTDSKGRITVPCAKPGEWMLSTVHMEPSADRAAADWESTWASLTWMMPASGRPAP